MTHFGVEFQNRSTTSDPKVLSCLQISPNVKRGSDHTDSKYIKARMRFMSRMTSIESTKAIDLD